MCGMTFPPVASVLRLNLDCDLDGDDANAKYDDYKVFSAGVRPSFCPGHDFDWVVAASHAAGAFGADADSATGRDELAAV
jgi:hypothetical protein